MSVYVDRLFDTVPDKRWPYARACHLIADSKSELVKFALCMGLKTAWIQKPDGPVWATHYDITEGKRKLAVALGAVELDTPSKFREYLKRHQGVAI